MRSLPGVSSASSSSSPRCELGSHETRSTEKVHCLLLSGDRLHFDSLLSLWLVSFWGGARSLPDRIPLSCLGGDPRAGIGAAVAGGAGRWL
jgi:hypothetical protein